jgi:hypothetical protein
MNGEREPVAWIVRDGRRVIHVILDEMEQINGGVTGVCRKIASVKHKINHDKHTTAGNWSTDVEGAMAELAVAKAGGLYYGFTNWSMKRPDVALFQVRSTTTPSGHLLLRQNDNPEETFIFVVGAYGEYDIIGWLVGKEGMIPKYWRDKDARGNPAWWIPQPETHLIATLKGYLK